MKLVIFALGFNMNFWLVFKVHRSTKFIWKFCRSEPKKVENHCCSVNTCFYDAEVEFAILSAITYEGDPEIFEFLRLFQ